MSETKIITENKARAVLAEANAMLDTLRDDGYAARDLRDRISMMETALFEAEASGKSDAVEVYGDTADLVAEFPGTDFLKPDGSLA